MCYNSLRSGKKAALFLNSILSELQNKSVKNMLSTLNWNFDGIHDKEKFTVPNLYTSMCIKGLFTSNSSKYKI